MTVLIVRFHGYFYVRFYILVARRWYKYYIFKATIVRNIYYEKIFITNRISKYLE